MASERGTTSFIQETLIPLLSGVIDLGQPGQRWRRVWTQVVDISLAPVAGNDATNKTYVDTKFAPTIATIQEVDGAPSITNPDLLAFDQADGFVVSNPVGNNVRVDLAAVPTSALAGPITQAKGGTNIDTSASTGIPKVAAGVWTVPTRVAAADGGTNIDSSGSTGAPKVSAGTWSVQALTSGQLLIGSTGAVPVAAALTAGDAIAVTNAAGAITITGIPRSYLAGLTMSTAGGSTTMTVAVGQAVDGTNVDTLTLAASTGKTTGAWVVGSGNGGLDTGVIANSTWYHFWLIKRTDTAVVDVLISLSATAPTMPANYTEKRRIGSGKTDGGGNWTAFTQDGDYFRWSASVLDVDANNPGAAAVTRTLTVPTGVNVFALVNHETADSAASDFSYLSDLSATDEAPSVTLAPLFTSRSPGAVPGAVGPVLIRTNTSAQIRSRCGTGGATVNLRIATLGWIDFRGRNA